MKELLQYAKDLESDFVNNNINYQSKIDLALSSLVTGDYLKSKQMFDLAIEIDSQFPSAWIGKAFAEIALVDDNSFNEINIDEYLTRALRTTQDILKYKVAILGCLAYRHALIIKKSVLAVEEAIKQKKAAEKKKSIAVATSVTGAVMAGTSKSRTGKVLGGSLAAGGAVKATQYQMEEDQLNQLEKSLYSAALFQTYSSAPIIKLCYTLYDNIDNINLKTNFSVVIESWKESIIYLFQKQREQLIERLKLFSPNDANQLNQLLTNPYQIQEFGEFVSFMRIIGLQNHQIYTKLDSVFTITLPKYFSDSDSIDKLKKAGNNQNIAFGIGAFMLVIGLLSIYTDYVQNDNYWVSYAIDLTGIILGIVLYMASKTEEMKKFEVEYLNIISEFKQIELGKNDLELNYIEEKTTSNNNRSLGI